MSQICVTFRSITAAQNAARALEQAGLPAQVLRTPRALQEQGCGYCVRAPAEPETIRQLRAADLPCKVVVGGAVITQDYADTIGADCYAADAMESVHYAQQILGT